MTHMLIYGYDEKLARWACERIPWMAYHDTMKAVGIATGGEADSQLLGVCVFNNYYAPQVIDGKTWYGLVEISFAAASPKWATRSTISRLLSIPFDQYNCRKVATVIPSTNKRAIRFNEGIGLRPEGTLRHHFAKGVHACIHGMMKSEYDARWRPPRPNIRPNPDRRHGQEHPVSPSSTASA